MKVLGHFRTKTGVKRGLLAMGVLWQRFWEAMVVRERTACMTGGRQHLVGSLELF